MRAHFLGEDPDAHHRAATDVRSVDGALYAPTSHELHLRRARGPSREPLRSSWSRPRQDRLASGVPARLLGSFARPHDRIGSADTRHRLARSWKLGARDQTAFPHAYLNVLLHGLNGALLVVLVFRLTRDRLTAWLAGLLFVATAVVTEAVSGVVGLADVLGGTGALLALLAVCGPVPTMAPALFGATLLGLFSKESALCIVPLAPLAALLTAQMVSPANPRRWVRVGIAAIAASSAFVLYVELRRRWFPVVTPADLSAQANAAKPFVRRAFAFALRWYAQPVLPHDPLNNPLITASVPYRIAGALRVFARGLGQVLLPVTLSGDYSAPQEPVPDRLSSRLTPKGIALAPVLLEILISGAHHEETDAPCAVIEGMEQNRAAVIAEAYRRWEQRDPTPLIPPFTSSMKSKSNSPKGKPKR